MLKSNELKAGSTRCDRCSEAATLVTGNSALCAHCAAQKRASADLPLKSASENLSSQHKRNEVPA